VEESGVNGSHTSQCFSGLTVKGKVLQCSAAFMLNISFSGERFQASNDELYSTFIANCNSILTCENEPRKRKKKKHK
jgi:hypothetical protein